MAQYTQLAGSTQIKVGAGYLTSLTISTTSSGTIAIYDTPDADTSNDPKIINTLTPAANAHFFFGEEGLFFSKGLYVAVANTLTFTVGYK